MRVAIDVRVDWPDHGFDPCTRACADGWSKCSTLCGCCEQPVCTWRQPVIRDGTDEVHADCYAVAVQSGVMGDG